MIQCMIYSNDKINSIVKNEQTQNNNLVMPKIAILNKGGEINFMIRKL